MMNGRNPQTPLVVERIPTDSVGAEIGVWRGDSSEQFLLKARMLHLVDAWSVDAYANDHEYVAKYASFIGSHDLADFQSYYDNVFATVTKRFRNRPVRIHRCKSADFFANFEGQVDWVYIDGDHSYEGCLADLRGAAKIVKKGGSIFGDDYYNRPGVRQACNEFSRATEIFSNQYQIRV